MDLLLTLAIAAFLVAAVVLCRASVFRLERVQERRVAGQTRAPLLAWPPGANFSLFNPTNYTAEGQRLLPLLLATQALWLIAVAAIVVLRARAA
ncbi:MAG TPA: hypothetical protein VIJ16_04170 [Gemmatimonadaceae bacterium]